MVVVVVVAVMLLCCGNGLTWRWGEVTGRLGCREQQLPMACGHNPGISRIRYALLETHED